MWITDLPIQAINKFGGVPSGFIDMENCFVAAFFPAIEATKFCGSLKSLLGTNRQPGVTAKGAGFTSTL